MSKGELHDQNTEENGLIKRGLTKTKPVRELIVETFDEFQKDNAMRLAASLSFYSIFSLAPLILIVLAVGTFIVGSSDAQAEILSYLRRWVGTNNAQVILNVSKHAQEEFSNVGATLMGGFTLLFGATAVFAELRQTLNRVWNVQPKPGLSWTTTFFRTRLLSFMMVLVVGSLLVITLASSTILSTVGQFLQDTPLPMAPSALHLINFAVSFGIITLAFTLVYKILPEAKIRWSDVWVGAVITSLLFTLGKSLIALYIGRSSLGSVYGAAGSLVLMLLWVYYSAQVFLLGAEFTQVYARRHGRRIEPTENAVRVPVGADA